MKYHALEMKYHALHMVGATLSSRARRAVSVFASIDESSPFVGGRIVDGDVARGVVCGRTPRALDVAAPFGHASCGDGNAVQFKEDPQVAFANLVIQAVERVVQRVVTKSRCRGLIAQHIKGSIHDKKGALIDDKSR